MTKTKIQGYEIEFEGSSEDCTAQCSVIKGRYCASLEVVLQTGCISDENWNTQKVPDAVVAKLEEWAKKQGYFN